ncbi:carboxypeptidase [Stachybotrys elegans]|uniref:Carboxypeptidase n=1 Tax=Stachybotrys elegans TaxID=80388 RepID=A0A8K0SM20_9HYPO|nr:carboxypeptidase [Stachybotrys elegans]
MKSLCLAFLYAGIASAARYAGNQRPLEKDQFPVTKAFPDLQGIRLLSPALISPGTVPSGFANNTAGPTDQSTLEAFLRTLAKRNHWITYHEPRFKSEEGRSIPYRRKLRIWLQGGVHGDEPAGDQALLALLGQLDNDRRWALSILEKADVVILPRYNPDGVAYFQRQLASGFDPNRDHAVLQRQQTRRIKQLLSDFDPHLAVDAHEFTASSRLGANAQWVKAQDIQVSPVKNPNIHPDIRALGEGLFLRGITAAVEKLGLRTGPYYTAPGGTDLPTLQEPGSVSHAGHNNGGLGQRLTFLTETRGIRLGDQNFHRRVAAGFTAIRTLLQVAVDNKNLVYSTIEGARQEFIDGNDDIIVTDRSRVTNTTTQFVEVATGNVVEVPVLFNNNTPPETTLTRARPEAYIFAAAWTDIAENLRVFGVEVETLSRDFYGTVQTLNVVSVTPADSRFEGIWQSRVTTQPGSRTVRIPAGGFRVSTRQQNAAYAFVLLEPENIASYATYGRIPLDRGDEYPIFRLN